VDEPEPRLHPQDCLADHPEAEVPGLNQPGMHWTDGHLVDTGSLNRHERELAGIADHLG
jgi:hypothetical protein